MKGGGVGLYGRPRPVPLAPISSENEHFHPGWYNPYMRVLEEHDRLPTAGDHKGNKGPLNSSSTTLAPTELSMWETGKK